MRFVCFLQRVRVFLGGERFRLSFCLRLLGRGDLFLQRDFGGGGGFMASSAYPSVRVLARLRHRSFPINAHLRELRLKKRGQFHRSESWPR